ncbi:hypothetical protein KVV02_004709 [Mortierella alpina]|uniref:CST complex subunit STN1 n=1 Tax=Mortierella alpina TaxID=64518 RepID=A0A9P8A467_MORAP|nr:hypothetical protein KVV02_004709 [Mortierella alpina]
MRKTATSFHCAPCIQSEKHAAYGALPYRARICSSSSSSMMSVECVKCEMNWIAPFFWTLLSLQRGRVACSLHISLQRVVSLLLNLHHQPTPDSYSKESNVNLAAMTTPQVLWGLDPFLHTPMQLMLFQVKALAPVPDMDGVYTHRGHPVRKVEVLGVVRRVHRAPKMFVYTLDDGTDTLPCIIWIPDRLQSLRDTSAVPWLEPYTLGQVLNIVGTPGAFRGQAQLTFQHDDSTVCTNPNAETLFRLRVLTKERYVYSQPVNVSGIDVEEATRIHKDQPPAILIMDKLRLWLQHRTLFFFTDIEEDDGMRTMATSIVNNLEPNLTQLQAKIKAHRLIVMVVHRLLSTGEIEYYDRPTMRFRVAKLKLRVAE